MSKEKKIESIILPLILNENIELVDLEFLKEGPNWFLRVYIDKEGGVTIEDCETISRLIEKKLDDNDPIEQPYILEVSSPGIDRPLKKDEDFIKYKGEIVDIKLYKLLNGTKEFQGELLGLCDDVISIVDEEGTEFNFSKKDVALTRLAVIF